MCEPQNLSSRTVDLLHKLLLLYRKSGTGRSVDQRSGELLVKEKWKKTNGRVRIRNLKSQVADTFSALGLGWYRP